MDFFKTLWMVCKTPSSIVSRGENKPWRPLFYYLLLAMFLAFFFSFLEGCSINREIRQGCEFIYQKTGGFSFSTKGLTTLKTPEEKKEYEIVTSRGKMRIDYLPAAILAEKDISSWDPETLYGIILLRNAIISWTKYSVEGNTFMVMYAPLEKETAQQGLIQVMDQKELASFVTGKTGKNGTEEIILREELKKGKYTDPVILSRIIEAFSSFGSLCLFLLQYVFLGFLSIVFFILIQLFRLGSDGKRMPFKVNCSLTLYAALPALLAGAVIQALHIPFLDFQNIFLLVFFIYDILIFNAYYRSFRTKNVMEENRKDDRNNNEEENEDNNDKGGKI